MSAIARGARDRRFASVPAVVEPTIVVDTAIYAALDNMGGKITLAGAVPQGGMGILDEIVLIDVGNQAPVLDITIFNADPTAATLTDNAAMVITAADASKVSGRIGVVAGDWVSVGTIKVATLRNLGALVRAIAGVDIYAALQVTSGTPDMVAATDLRAKFIVYPLS